MDSKAHVAIICNAGDDSVAVVRRKFDLDLIPRNNDIYAPLIITETEVDCRG